MKERKGPPPEAIERAIELAREVALGSPGAEPLEHAHNALPPHQVECWKAFEETFAALARSDDARRHAWASILRREVRAALADPQKVLFSSNKHDLRMFEAQIWGWKDEIDPLAAWRRRGYVHIDGRYPFYHLHLLLLIDPAAWCSEIDALPALDLMDWAFFSYTHLKEEPERIEDLLRIAPTVFEKDGRWVASRSVLALLLTDYIPRAAPSEAWMRQAFKILIERRDGKYIAFAYLGRLANHVLIGHRRFLDETISEQQAFKILAETLASAGFGVRDARDVWAAAEEVAKEKHEQEKARPLLKERQGKPKIPDDRGEGARTLRSQGFPLLFGAAVMLGESPQQAEAEAFWRFFEELLLGRDPELSLARQHGPAREEVPARFGRLLSRLPDPGATFREIYRKLEPQRRRTGFSHLYEGYDDDIGSMLLIDIGCHAALYWHKREAAEAATTAACALFWWIDEAARRLWLTSRHGWNKEKRKIVCQSFAFMPYLFGEHIEVALRRALPPIANDPWMVCAAGSLLFRNGIAPERLVPLMRGAGVDLEMALRDAYQWATLTEDKSIPKSVSEHNEDFPPTFEELVRALGLALSIVESHEKEAPLKSEATLQRRAFSLGIPWAATLLQRLAEERCVPRRLVPLDAKGTTWLMQASIPLELQDRFGISPEIRILAVHGDVRGRDLRAALQDPEGAANIDPDLLVVAGDQPELAKKLSWLAGPWGQRIPWAPAEDEYAHLSSVLREHLPSFDLFDYRDPVQGSALLGRQAEIDELTARLLRGEAVGVIGLRKVGKSSLLRAVADRIDPVGARRGMFESLTVPLPNAEPEALVVSLDVQGVAGAGFEVLLKRLAERLDERLALAGVRVDPQPTSLKIIANSIEQDGGRDGYLVRDPMDTLRGLLALALERTKLPVCFILDEYDLLFEGYDGGEAGIPKAEQLLQFLRAQAQATGRVSLALIGRDPVFLERPLLGGVTNPLAGWARPIFLGPLGRRGADELLVRLGKRVGLDVGPATLEAAWQWTGGHPLLLRQYGAALYELAHAPPTRPRPVPTDPIHADAPELFLIRDAVQTICSEVRALLDARFPDSLALLEALADAPPDKAPVIVDRHGGPRGRASMVLRRFGIVYGSAEEPSLPGIYRAEFSISWSGIERSAARGA